MSLTTATAHPPNSLVIIEDIKGGDAPLTMNSSLINFTDSCIAVGCNSDYETTFTLGTPDEVNPKFEPHFSGMLNTPSKVVAVRTVYLETIVEAPVQNEKTAVRIWVNESIEPTKIFLSFI